MGWEATAGDGGSDSDGECHDGKARIRSKRHFYFKPDIATGGHSYPQRRQRVELDTESNIFVRWMMQYLQLRPASQEDGWSWPSSYGFLSGQRPREVYGVLKRGSSGEVIVWDCAVDALTVRSSRN